MHADHFARRFSDLIRVTPGEVDRVWEDELSALWQQQWLECPPFADELKLAYRDRWVRFHSLPESQRYPENRSRVRHRAPSLQHRLGRTVPRPRSPDHHHRLVWLK